MKLTFPFKTTVWKYNGPAAWYFVSLPQDLADEIRQLFRDQEEGWGRLKVAAQTGNSKWNTAIWFDTKQKTYILPLKAAIRKKEKVETGMVLEVTILI